jgi:uncharacterized protein
MLMGSRAGEVQGLVARHDKLRGAGDGDPAGVLTAGIRLIAWLCFLLLLSLPAIAQEFRKTIMTGGPSGTYIQIGRDISKIASQCGLTLNVEESAGSFENLLAVRNNPFTQFGIAQHDVLEYVKRFAADSPYFAKLLRGVRIVIPLYDEELHILATRDIANLQDLTGRRVAIGLEKSGTWLTASMILDSAGIRPVARMSIGPDAALHALISGEIDALFYVAGVPATLFENSAITTDQFHLVPITDSDLREIPDLREIYDPETIAGNVYAFQHEPVQVVVVKAVLMTYEYRPSESAYQRSSCQAVSEISHLITTHFDDLRKSGHPKWQHVDPLDYPPGWNIGSCVTAGLSATYSMKCRKPANVSQESDVNKVYRAEICRIMGC